MESDLDLSVAVLSDKVLPEVRRTGVGVVAFDLSLALADLGVDVRLICRGNRKSNRQIGRLEIETIPHFTTRCEVALLGREFDIAHSHTVGSFFGVVLAKMIGKRVFQHSHRADRNYSTSRIMNESLFGLCDRFLFTSEYAMKSFGEHYFQKSRVIHNGVDSDLFKPLPATEVAARKFGIDQSQRFILSLGSVQRRKCQHLIAKILPKLLSHDPDLRYINVGPIYDKAYALDLVASLPPAYRDRITLLGEVQTADLPHLINSATLCVHPAISEAFGLAVIEEMSCGKPVVAFNTCSLPEIITSMTDGVLVEPSAKAFADSIIRLLSDTSLSLRLGRNARRRAVEEFTWKNAARSFLEICKEK